MKDNKVLLIGRLSDTLALLYLHQNENVIRECILENITLFIPKALFSVLAIIMITGDLFPLKTSFTVQFCVGGVWDRVCM